MVTIRTSNGKVYTNPKDVHIARNEKTEMFYDIVMGYPKEVKKSEKETGEKNNRTV